MIEEQQEPMIEGKPEADSWLYSISKYGGDIFFPPAVIIEEPEPGILAAPGGSPIRGINREQFFSEVRAYFHGIPWTPRTSRAGTGPSGSRPRGFQPQARPPAPAGFKNIAPETSENFLENVEQTLLAKFRPESRYETTYRTKREAERREDQKRDFVPKVMTKDQFLDDLQDRIGSVQWRAPNANHKSTITRPGLRQNLQKELKDGSY